MCGFWFQVLVLILFFVVINIREVRHVFYVGGLFLCCLTPFVGICVSHSVGIFMFKCRHEHRVKFIIRVVFIIEASVAFSCMNFLKSVGLLGVQTATLGGIMS